MAAMSDEESEELLETEAVLENIDIEETLQPETLKELLDQLNLESVLGGVGAAVGSSVGAVVGRKVGAALRTERESVDEPESDDSAEEESDETDDSTDEDTEDESDETGSEKPATREELEALSYRELQSLARDTDVKGNLSRDEMTEQLADEFGLDSE